MAASGKFVIVCFARTGTHLLESALNRHPDIECLYEPFNPLLYGVHSTSTILEAAWARPGVVGFPVHWEWQGRDEYPDLWEALREDGELKVIQLHRENILQQYISKKMLDTTRVHVVHEDDEQPDERPTLTVDVNELLRYIFLIETSVGAKRRWFSDHETHSTTYERLTGDTEAELEAIQRFLGVEVMPLRPSTVKQEQRSLSQVIENFDEVAAAVRRSGWSHFLPQEAQPEVVAQ